MQWKTQLSEVLLYTYIYLGLEEFTWILIAIESNGNEYPVKYTAVLDRCCEILIGTIKSFILDPASLCWGHNSVTKQSSEITDGWRN